MENNNIDKVSEEHEVSANIPNMRDEWAYHEQECEVDKHAHIEPHDTTLQHVTVEHVFEKPMSLVERMLSFVVNHGFFKSLGAVVLVIVCVTLWQLINAINYEKAAESIMNKMAEQQAQTTLVAQQAHSAGSALRLENNPKINNVLLRMLHELNADRVSILEMHNGKENPTNLPFIYCDMTYEETKGDVPYIADEYEQMNMSKYSYFTYLIQERSYCGNTTSLWNIDKKFATKIESNDTKYVAVIVIKNEIDIGFLFVSYLEEPKVDEHKLILKLSDYAQELGYLLNLSPSVEPSLTK